MITHGDVIEALRRRFESDPRVFAFWIEGSIAAGAADELADLDFVMDVADGTEVAVLSDIEAALDALGRLDLISELERPNPYLWYKVFHIDRSADHLLIDATVQRHSRNATFWEGADDRPLVIFDKAHVVRLGVLDTPTQEAAKAARLRALQARYAQRSRVLKYVERERFLEAWACYQKFVLRPLVELVRLRYVPLRADHGLVHISDQVPEPIRRRLEYLHQIGSLGDIAAKARTADVLFRSVLNELGRPSATMAEVDVVLRIANDRTNGSWSVVRRLPGGSQQGAYELTDPHGERAVLKWHTRNVAADQLAETARAIETGRARGWPTPRWLAFGPLPDEGAYILEEFIDGTRPTRLDSGLLDQLLAANRIQAGLRPNAGRSWSAYIRRVVFENEAGDAARLRTHAETAPLGDRLERATAGARGLVLPDTDLVHGDFTLWNVLVRGGTAHLIDAAHAGRGTRAYDLASLLVGAAADDAWADSSIGSRQRLETECRTLVGADGLLVCVAARLIVFLEWGLRHWSPAGIQDKVARSEALLEELQAASM